MDPPQNLKIVCPRRRGRRQKVHQINGRSTEVTETTVTAPTVNLVSKFTLSEISGLRRSPRIKQITTSQGLITQGLVADKNKFKYNLIKIEVAEERNAKFFADNKTSLKKFQTIKKNAYKFKRLKYKDDKINSVCNCFITAEEKKAGELCCGESCLNRISFVECGPSCNGNEYCTNKAFQTFLCSPCLVFLTEKKGFGIKAETQIECGQFIMEYIGEVIDKNEFERRWEKYALDKVRHYYFMALENNAYIDGTRKGNISRFTNHSCDPNAEIQKWTVNGESRIGFFSVKTIKSGEEITIDYKFERCGVAQRCYCETTKCRGWISAKTNIKNKKDSNKIDNDDDHLTELFKKKLNLSENARTDLMLTSAER